MITLHNQAISVDIDQRYAKIVYSFKFENLNNFGGSKELKFEITIEASAFISNFRADIDGEIFNGKTKEKKQAKKEYDDAKKKNENAILISQPYDNIPNVFQIKTNIDQNSKIVLDLTIEEFMTKKFNFNQLNIQILRNWDQYNITQKYKYISFKLNIKDNSALYDIIIPASSNTSNTSPALSSSNNIIIDNKTVNKLNTSCSMKGKIDCTENSSINEFVLKYKIKGEQNESNVLYDNSTKTFCHIISDVISGSMISGELDNIQTEGTGGNDVDIDNKVDNIDNILIPRRVMFVIDQSGSMAGGKWRRTVSSTIIALKQLRINYDRYNIILFNGSISMFSQMMLVSDLSNKRQAISYLNRSDASGGTNINGALLKAIKLIKNDIKAVNDDNDNDDYNFYMNQIIFITDGEPNTGEKDPKKIILNVIKSNKLDNIDKYSSKISIFSFGVGKDSNDSSWINDLNHSFLKLLSLTNNGIYKRIKQSNITSKLETYYKILSQPLLTNINIKYKSNNNYFGIKNLTNTKFNTLFCGNDIIICGQIHDKIQSNDIDDNNDVKADNDNTNDIDDIDDNKDDKDNNNDNQDDNKDPNDNKDDNQDDKDPDDNKDDNKSYFDVTATISAVSGKAIKNNKLMFTKPVNISKDISINFDKNCNNNNLRRIWAYLKLQQLADKKLISDNDVEGKYNEYNDDDISPLTLAMNNKFVSPWTSMIVVKTKYKIYNDNDAEYGKLYTGTKEHHLKLVTIGDANCGKTSLILRFTDNIFDETKNDVTIGVNFKTKKLKVNNNYFKVSLWDSAGQERFTSTMAPLYLRNADGIIFVCDGNNIDSINNLLKWAQNTNQTISFNKNNSILIVNKSDLMNDNNSNQDIVMNKIKEISNDLGIDYVVTSAKSNNNVQNSFYKLIGSIYDSMFVNEPGQNVSSRDDNNNNMLLMDQSYDDIYDRRSRAQPLMHRSYPKNAKGACC